MVQGVKPTKIPSGDVEERSSVEETITIVKFLSAILKLYLGT